MPDNTDNVPSIVPSITSAEDFDGTEEAPDFAKPPTIAVNFPEEFINLIEQVFNLTGKVITKEQAVKYGADPVKWQEMTNHPKFKAMLLERGIIKRNSGPNAKLKDKILSATQLAVANCMLDLSDTRSNKKKLQDMNVSTQTWNKWLKDPVFQQYMYTRGNQLLLENQHEISVALIDRIKNGDLNAIKYLHEWQGIFVSASARNNGSGHVDVVQLVQSIIEILGKHVKDPETLFAISNDIEGLIRARNAAKAVTAAFEDSSVGLTDPGLTDPTEIEVTEADVKQLESHRSVTVAGLDL